MRNPRRASGRVASGDQPTLVVTQVSTGVPDPALLPDLSRALGALTELATPGSYLDDPTLPQLLTVLRADWPFAADEITVVDGAMDGIEARCGLIPYAQHDAPPREGAGADVQLAEPVVFGSGAATLARGADGATAVTRTEVGDG